MESYEAIPVWNLVSIKAVPPRTRIFRLKWVFDMKNMPGSVQLKFAPRGSLAHLGRPARLPPRSRGSRGSPRPAGSPGPGSA
jgi:hypothetical protein